MLFAENIFGKHECYIVAEKPVLFIHLQQYDLFKENL